MCIFQIPARYSHALHPHRKLEVSRSPDSVIEVAPPAQGELKHPGLQKENRKELYKCKIISRKTELSAI